MTQDQRDLVHPLLRNAPFDLGGIATAQRPLLEPLLTAHPLPGDVHVTRAELGGVPVALATLGGSGGVLFHLHGGGFAVGSAQGSLGLATSLARRTGLSVVAVDYRLAPEHPFPAAADDVRGIRGTGRARGRHSPHRRLRRVRRRQPRRRTAGGRTSGRPAAPFVDRPDVADDRPHRVRRELSGKAAVDPNITAEAIRTRVADYLDGTDPADPRVSPIFADLCGFRRC